MKSNTDGDMSINENLFTKKVVSEVSGSSDRVAEARKILWRFPVRDERAPRSRELGKQIIALTFVVDTLIILSALLLSFYIRFQTPILASATNSRPSLVAYLLDLIIP